MGKKSEKVGQWPENNSKKRLTKKDKKLGKSAKLPWHHNLIVDREKSSKKVGGKS